MKEVHKVKRHQDAALAKAVLALSFILFLLSPAIALAEDSTTPAEELDPFTVEVFVNDTAGAQLTAAEVSFYFVTVNRNYTATTGSSSEPGWCYVTVSGVYAGDRIEVTATKGNLTGTTTHTVTTTDIANGGVVLDVEAAPVSLDEVSDAGGAGEEAGFNWLWAAVVVLVVLLLIAIFRPRK